MILVASLIKKKRKEEENSCVLVGKTICENIAYVIEACSSSIVFPSNILIPTS